VIYVDAIVCRERLGMGLSCANRCYSAHLLRGCCTWPGSHLAVCGCFEPAFLLTLQWPPAGQALLKSVHGYIASKTTGQSNSIQKQEGRLTIRRRETKAKREKQNPVTTARFHPQPQPPVANSCTRSRRLLSKLQRDWGCEYRNE